MVGFWNLYPVYNTLQQIQGPPLAPFGAVSPASTMSYAPKLLRPERIFSPAQHLHSFLMLTPSLAYVSLKGSPFKLRILAVHSEYQCVARDAWCLCVGLRRATFIVNKASFTRFPTPGYPACSASLNLLPGVLARVTATWFRIHARQSLIHRPVGA